MVPRVLLVGIPVGTEPDELRAIVGTHPHTRYPVYSGDLDHIVGSIHIKELLRHLVCEPAGDRPRRAAAALRPGPAPLDEVLAAMRRHRAQMAVVMDEHGGTAGLMTIEDLFEEVVGEIEEGRRPDADRARATTGTLASAAPCGSRRRARRSAATLEHPEVTTVSGLVLLLLGRPAQRRGRRDLEGRPLRGDGRRRPRRRRRGGHRDSRRRGQE